MNTVIDQMHRRITISQVPKRIVSLVPSQTELLVALGLEDCLVGITKFCIHPPHLLKKVEKIGGTKNLNISKILELQPDIIIGNKEENEELQIIELMKHAPVWMSDIYNLKDSLAMIEKLGEIFEKNEQAQQLIATIYKGFQKVHQIFNGASVVYLIWNNPIMSVGPNTFIHWVLEHIGLENKIQTPRYPELKIDFLHSLAPDYLFLSTEPFPFKESHVHYFNQILPHTNVQLVDGEMFSWYGSRLQYAPEYFLKLLEQ